MELITPIVTQFAATCTDGSFFGFPKWYKYLDVFESQAGQNLGGGVTCTPVVNGLSDIWLVVAAVIEILLRLGALIAVAFVIVGGVRYITSHGEPDNLKKALGTIISALIGLVIALSSVIIINFVAGRF